MAAGPLPGQTLVVLDPASGLVVDVECGEDGHAQERALVGRIPDRVAADNLWVADRNFCTSGIVFGIARRGAAFAIRQHASTLMWTREAPGGRCDSGILFEQDLWLDDGTGGILRVRRITLVLDTPPRDGAAEVHVRTNLPMAVYRERWQVAGLFQDATTVLRCELNTLGYPRAALFGFCVALAAANVFATLRAAFRATHGEATVDANVSTYYLADEVAGTYRGMMVAIPPAEWVPFGTCDVPTFATSLVKMIAGAKLSRYQKRPRGPKKPRPRRTRFPKAKHISTAKLLAAEKANGGHP